MILVTNIKYQVVEEYSAKMDVPNERQCGINRDHVTLCKFDSESDPDWKMIYPHIKDLASIASGFRKVTPSRFPIKASNLWTGSNESRSAEKIVRYNIPSFADQAFFERGQILEGMYEYLAPGSGKNQSFGLFGLGGVGKTQLAMKFVDEYADQYPYIFWMHGESETKLTPQYDQIAIRLGLVATSEYQDDSKRLFYDWLISNLDRPCLLIFDNADDVNVLRWFWPPHSPMLSVLLTSRDRSTMHQRLVASGQAVTPLSHKDGASFFLSYLSDAGESEREPALAISKMLGGHPLALRHAAGYVEDMACSLTEFISDFETSQAVYTYEPTAALVGYDKALATLFDVSLRDLSEDAQLILDILSLMDPDDVAESVIFRGRGDLVHFPDVLLVRSKYNQAIGALQKTSLLIKDRTRSKISIHRLVQDTVRRRWDSSRSQTVFEIASCCLVSIFPTQDKGQSMIADYGRCKVYAPHVLSIEERFRKSHHAVRLSIELAELFGHCGFYLYETGLYGSSCTLLTTAKDILDQAVGSTPNPVSGLVLNNLSVVHSILTNFDEAFKLSEEALWHRTRCLTDGHPDIATTYANHAGNLFDCGNYENAVNYYSIALKIRESTPELSSMLEQTLSNFGRNYTAMGDLENADKLLQRAMDMHPKMGRVTLYMAQTYWHAGNLKLAQGKIDEGFSLHKMSLESRTSVLGDSHFLTGLSLHKYASLLHQRGHRKQAVPLFEKAIEIFESTAQIEKGLLPRSLASLANLFGDIAKFGDYYQSEDGKPALQMSHEHKRRAEQLYASIPPFNLPPSQGEPQDAWVQLDCR